MVSLFYWHKCIEKYPQLESTQFSKHKNIFWFLIMNAFD